MIKKIRSYFYNKNLKTKLIFTFALSVGLPLLFISSFSAIYSFNTSNKHTRENLKSELETAKLLYEKKITSIEKIVNKQAKDNLVVLNLDLMLYSHIKSVFTNSINENNLSFLLAVDENFEILVNSENKNLMFSKETFLKTVLSNEKTGNLSMTKSLNLNNFYRLKNMNIKINNGLNSIISVAPVYSYKKELIAYIIGGYLLGENTENSLVKEISHKINSDVLLLTNYQEYTYSKGKIENYNFKLNFEINKDKNYYNLKINNMKNIYTFLPIKCYNNEINLYLGIGIPKKNYIKKRNKIVMILISISILSLLIAMKIAYILSKQIIKPIDSMLVSTKNIINGNYLSNIKIESNDEIGVLGENFNYMTQEIQKLLTELRLEIIKHEEAEEEVRWLNSNLEDKVKERTKELENSLNRLKNTQSQLIESEKMASLGQIVAGVSHEINTPLGVAVTASSLLSEQSKYIETAYNTGEMTKEIFETFLKTAVESSDITMSNLNKASELVRSFKQVAVDQSTELKRKFNLRIYIEDILRSLKPKLKKTKHKIIFECKEELILDSYPSVIYQILSNLINNSIFHGFENIKEGIIDIKVYKEDNNVKFIYSDNGIGIPNDALDKIYEPFYTTKRNVGGSGLGMHIIYNLVYHKLKGTLSLESQINRGVLFSISIPLI